MLSKKIVKVSQVDIDFADELLTKFYNGEIKKDNELKKIISDLEGAFERLSFDDDTKKHYASPSDAAIIQEASDIFDNNFNY